MFQNINIKTAYRDLLNEVVDRDLVVLHNADDLEFVDSVSEKNLKYIKKIAHI